MTRPQVRAPNLAGLRHQLVGALVQEPHELDLGHRPQPGQRHAERRPDDGRLGQRRVEHAPVAEASLQAVGGPKHTAQLANVLAHDDHALVAAQRLAQRAIDRLHHDRLGFSHRAASMYRSSVGSGVASAVGDRAVDPRQGVGLRVAFGVGVPQAAPLQVRAADAAADRASRQSSISSGGW